MSPKTKTVSALLAACLASFLVIAQVGCLTPQQQTDLGAYSQQIDRDAATALELKAELGKYRAALAAILADVKAGKVPAASGLELAAQVMQNLEATQGKLVAAQQAVEATREKVAALKASGAPWWAYALPALLAAAQIAGTVVPQLAFLVPVAAAGQAALQRSEQKLATTQEVAGSLSRTLDRLAPKPEACSSVDPALADRKQELLLREQSADELAVKADYDEIRRLARFGQI